MKKLLPYRGQFNGASSGKGGGQADSRLVAIVRLLARGAARNDYERVLAEMREADNDQKDLEP